MGDLMKCSRCNSEANLSKRYVACISRSFWEKIRPGMIPLYTTLKEDIKIWEIKLCNACIGKGYEEYLLNRMKGIVKFFKMSPFMFLAAMALMYFLYRCKSGDTSSKIADFLLTGGMLPFLSMIDGVLFLASTLGVLVQTIRYFYLKNKLHKIQQTGILLKVKMHNNAFKGEAERIIKEQEVENRNNIKDGFPLPDFIYSEEILNGKRESPGRMNEQVREIIAVANTSNELDKVLPTDWKNLLQQRHKDKEGISP